MLGLPTVGMNRSVNEHNINRPAFYDWLEGSILLDADVIYGSDVVDVLTENEVYAKQELAWELVQDAWAEISRRLQWLGESSPIEIDRDSFKRKYGWRDVPAHSFCLVLSYAKWYPEWAAAFGNDYNEQGELFELLTKESMEKHFPDWTIHRTGWGISHVSRLDEVVSDVLAHLGEVPGNLEPWTDERGHEAGMDLLCYRSFKDGKVGVPVFLMQCASGKNWDGKLDTPRVELWKKLIQFASDPKKAFSMPYAISDRDFLRKCEKVNGMFLDQYRLLAPGLKNPDWVSQDLKDRLIAWLEPRIDALPGIQE